MNTGFRWLLIVALTSGSALAQCERGWCPAPRDHAAPACNVSARSRAAVVRVVNAKSRGASLGSGALVATFDGQSYVLTCHHLFKEGVGRVTVQFPHSNPLAAEVAAKDATYDLVLLSIAAVKTPPLEVEIERPPIGTLAACGYGGGGQFAAACGPMTGWATPAGAKFPSLMMRGAVRPGDSGGPVLNSKGQVVAVVWGARHGMTYATAHTPLRLFLQRALPKRGADKHPPQRPAGNFHLLAWSLPIAIGAGLTLGYWFLRRPASH